MRAAFAAICVMLAALPLRADPLVDRLIDAMGVPGLVAAFAEDGVQSAAELDDGFLNGQGGDVFAETVRRLHAPARIEAQMRTGMAAALSADTAQQALVFFDSDMGERIVGLEVEARRAMVDQPVEDAARAAADDPGDGVLALISARDLVERNTDIAMAAQAAFFDGIAVASGIADQPDLEGQRGRIAEETRAWVTGYYVLVASALEEGDLETYTAFWETDVGQAVDAAMYETFQDVYVDLSYALGQAVGRLLPQNEL